MSSAPRWGRRLPRAEDALFVYGTLQFPEVLVELLGRAPDLTPAVLPGRRAAALPGRAYPGLVAAPAGAASGFLMTGLTAAEWRVLDAFEDDEYDLIPVSVHAGDREVYAWTYSWLSAVLPGEWSAAAFTADHLPRYAQQCAAWRRELVLLTETA
ncbi:gamma-glutamylcyclotransferase [Nocardia yamanashiensis]|uniref:gamma-glutamylcyclotransferase family protein n=1 Tax=Nocardia yamanashiensis TaxID=209247 RepID=UPI001E28743D|nr:gamma-glutamylcyclotransferase family protein [Nocardia yamanashiensis]UGT42504.1 gamma-glutamylcyclotransferase [Nocardia yamanashiensis]